ncbi:MAG: hypothetical protein BWY56_00242 [Acidobacteria bacterium ADurb.Bin340]|nr:MAG: hypothetical protein BWY56_00242 [Acidobacteria bacterium ADurb.Bin340]
MRGPSTRREAWNASSSFRFQSVAVPSGDRVTGRSLPKVRVKALAARMSRLGQAVQAFWSFFFQYIFMAKF